MKESNMSKNSKTLRKSKPIVITTEEVKQNDSIKGCYDTWKTQPVRYALCCDGGNLVVIRFINDQNHGTFVRWASMYMPEVTFAK